MGNRESACLGQGLSNTCPYLRRLEEHPLILETSLTSTKPCLAPSHPRPTQQHGAHVLALRGATGVGLGGEQRDAEGETSLNLQQRVSSFVPLAIVELALAKTARHLEALAVIDLILLHGTGHLAVEGVLGHTNVLLNHGAPHIKCPHSSLMAIFMPLAGLHIQYNIHSLCKHHLLHESCFSKSD